MQTEEFNNRYDLAPAFVLASIISSYPSNHFIQNLGILLQDKNIEILSSDSCSYAIEASQVFKSLSIYIESEDHINDLRSDYIDLFDRGHQVNSLYETEYGRNRALSKGNELVDISGFYHAFGFEFGGEGAKHEMIDHVSVELEFYALLMLKSQLLHKARDTDGMATVLDARKKFLFDHLSRFVGAICERPGVAESPFYYAVFAFCRSLVYDECARLGVVPEAIGWLSAEADTGEIKCGC